MTTQIWHDRLHLSKTENKGEWMLSRRHSTEQSVRSRRPCMRLETQRAQKENSTDSEYFECIQQESEEEL